MKNHEIGRLCRTDPEAAAAKMREVYVTHGASVRKAALAVGCTRWTFKTWIRMLDLTEEFRGVREILSAELSESDSATESRP